MVSDDQFGQKYLLEGNMLDVVLKMLCNKSFEMNWKWILWEISLIVEAKKKRDGEEGTYLFSNYINYRLITRDF